MITIRAATPPRWKRWPTGAGATLPGRRPPVWKPVVRPDCWLDVSGCAHLFGGEAAMLEDLTGRLARVGYTVRAGLADTTGAAWAAARFGEPARLSRSSCPPANMRTRWRLCPSRRSACRSIRWTPRTAGPAPHSRSGRPTPRRAGAPLRGIARAAAGSGPGRDQ